MVELNPTDEKATQSPQDGQTEVGATQTPANLLTPPQWMQGWTPTRIGEMECRAANWLIPWTIERNTVAMLFGDSCTGKSFLALDWAYRIATGGKWAGKPITPGPVVYIAGEGQGGLVRRGRAWELTYGGDDVKEAPLYITPTIDATDPASYLYAAQVMAEQLPAPPAMIVLDTLAKCFGNGDENSTSDMNRFVRGCDELRDRFGAAVLVVHHTGHGNKDRARGGVALHNGMDAEYRISRIGDITKVECTKMKDAEPIEPVNLQMKPVALPGLVDQYGKQATSMVFEADPVDITILLANLEKQRGPSVEIQRQMLDVIREMMHDQDGHPLDVGARTAFRERCKQAGIEPKRITDTLNRLSDNDWIKKDGDLVLSHTP